MEDAFNITLLREKFVIEDVMDDLSDTPPVIALSNRMSLVLNAAEYAQPETFVIRTQNMHSCVRLSAAVAKEYMERGPIMSRDNAFGWATLWDDVIKGYEKDWNPDIWGVIYYKGRVLFEQGARHPFLDIIEKCDAITGKSYEESVQFAENAFQQAGKEVSIHHDSNVALILKVDDTEAKGGIILRGAHKKSTFNFSVKPKKYKPDPIRVPTVLTACAAFLEGVQLSYTVGMGTKKKQMGLLEKYSDEDRKVKRGTDRLINLTNAIESLELKYIVNYRPDKPNFVKMAKEAEDAATAVLATQLEQRIQAGELNPKDWIQ